MNYDSFNHELQELLRLPSKNLEKIVSQLNKEIEKRQLLEQSILAQLEDNRLDLSGLKNQAQRFLAYNDMRTWHSSLEADIQKIDESIARAKIESFRDVLKLKERLWEVEDKLEKEKVKHRLIE